MHYVLLLPECGWHVISCLKPLLPWLPCLDSLYLELWTNSWSLRDNYILGNFLKKQCFSIHRHHSIWHHHLQPVALPSASLSCALTVTILSLFVAQNVHIPLSFSEGQFYFLDNKFQVDLTTFRVDLTTFSALKIASHSLLAGTDSFERCLLSSIFSHIAHLFPVNCSW